MTSRTNKIHVKSGEREMYIKLIYSSKV